VETGWYESVSLSDYFGVIARRKWIVLLVTVLMTVAAVAYSKNQTPKYQATASLPSPQSATTEAKNGGVTWSQVHAPLADTTKIASIVVGTKDPDAIPAVGTLHPQPPTFLQVKGSGLAADELIHSSTVLPAATGDSIEFTVNATDPTVAKQLANAWAEVYGAWLLNDAEVRNATSWNSINRILHPPKDPTTGVAPPGPPTNVANTLQTRADGYYAGLISPPADPQYQPAESANQTQPQTTRNTILGLVLGLILGVILAFIQDLLDKRIRTADEVGRRLRVPLLASIPSPPRSLRDHPLVLLAPRGGAQGPSAEAYRIAKLNLGTVMRANRAKAVMFVAAADSEGTSRTVANMAVALARSGSHVVLVDANMRRPAIERFFGLDDRTGLSDILSGHGDLADALTIVDAGGEQPDDAAGNGRAATGGLLEVLPAGPPPADAADLLESRTMSELLGELRGRADIVLIDAPPMLPVTDAMMLGSKVDGVIVVARARLASRPHMVALARALDACAAPTLGFLFTGVSVSEENEYGGYVGVGGAGLSQTRTPNRERELL
jgi:Mrp family chromosome partitioning ATPase/capsular polysaccharide biosynthesis protein